MKTYNNVVTVVPNYATSGLQETLTKYGDFGFKLVNVIMAQNKHNAEVMYLFFTKEVE